MDNKVFTAKLGKTVGLNGLIKVYIESDFPEQFKVGSSFATNKNKTLVIEQYNQKNGSIKFEGVDSIEDAKKLVNQFLFSTLEQTRQTCSLSEKEFFWFDIIGCKIVEESKELGVVKDIHRYPLSDYLEVTTHSELVSQNLPNNFLIPYIDRYIQSVDINNKTICVADCFEILENS